MAKQSVGQKAVRSLKFLMGLRNPRVAACMVGYGFTPKDLQEGFRRLAALSGLRMDLRSVPTQDPAVVTAIDEFENTWFPVAQATLEAHFPQIAAAFFRNLSQKSGVEVVISVSTFLNRLAELEQGGGEFAEHGKAARALLSERGLTSDKVKDAEGLISALNAFAAQPMVEGPSAEEQQAAEDHLWAWYLEWSRIARVAVKDGRLLRVLGFAPRTRSGEVVIDATLESPVLPAVTETTPRLLKVANA